MDRLKRLLFHNWWLKLLSLALAYALWALVTQSPVVETHISAMLELRQMPPGLRVSGEVPTRVHLHLRGPEPRLRALQPEEVAVVINLQEAAAGNHRFTLDPSNVELPPGIEVVRILPQEVRFELVER